MNPALLIPIAGMMIPIVVVPTALAFKFSWQVRKLEHAERMKALELGRTLPQDESWWSPPRLCLAIGGVVPIGVFVCAWLTTVSVGYQDGVWVSAMSVGLSGVIGGTILTARHFAQRERSQLANEAYSKPHIEDDAYDVVGARG